MPIDVNPDGAAFSDLYRDLGGDKAKGWTKLWASTSKAGRLELTTHSAARWSRDAGLRAAADAVRRSISTEYGEEVAARVFQNVFGNEGQSSKMTLDQLQGLKHALQFEKTKAEQAARKKKTKAEQGAGGNEASRRATTFSDIEREVQAQTGLSEDKHLRFRGTKGLYFHQRTAKSLLPIHRLWATSPDAKRKAAGPKIWKALANEFSKDAANFIFEKVFGANKASDTPHEVPVTLKQLGQIREQIDAKKELDDELKSARRSIVKFTDRADQLVRIALLGLHFADDDPSTVISDFARSRNKAEFRQLSLVEIAPRLNDIDVKSDKALAKVPADLREKVGKRLEALRVEAEKAIVAPSASDREWWRARTGGMGRRLTDPKIAPKNFERYTKTLIDVASSEADARLRYQAYAALKAAIGQMRTDNEEIKQSIPDIKAKLSQFPKDLYSEAARKCTEEAGPNARARASRALTPQWSEIEAKPEDIDGQGHRYRSRPGSDAFQAPPPISDFASSLQPDKGPVKDTLDELRAHLKAHTDPEHDHEVIHDPSDKNKVKPLTWDNFQYVWKTKFAKIWQDPGYREFGTAYQMRRSMEHVLNEKTASERAHALANFVMNAATCEYGVEQGILNKYTRDIMGQTNLTEDQIQESGDAERYRQGIEQALQQRRSELFTNDNVSTHIFGDQIMKHVDPVHQRTFLLNAIGNHVGVQPDKGFEYDKYASVTRDDLARMPQFEMLNHFYGVYTPKEMVKATKDHINGLLSDSDEKTSNRHFQRLQEAFFADERDRTEDYLSYELDDDKVTYALTDLGAAKILEQMGHLERVDPAPSPSPPADADGRPHGARDAESLADASTKANPDSVQPRSESDRRRRGTWPG
jgi:hypothetical protein